MNSLNKFYKIGDRIKIIKINEDTDEAFHEYKEGEKINIVDKIIGTQGTIENILSSGDYPITIRLDYNNKSIPFAINEFTKII